MGLPLTLDNAIRAHDDAFDAFLGRIRVDYDSLSGGAKPDHPILRRMASPQRAFASITSWLVSHGWITGADVPAMQAAAGDFAVLPLPVCSWEREEPVKNLEHSGVPKTWRGGQFNQATQEFTSYQWPAMYTCEYRVNFWCLKRYTEVWIKESIMAELGKVGAGESEVFLMVAHPDPFGTRAQALRLESSSNLSELEGEDNQRFIRWEMSFTMNMVVHRAPLTPDPSVVAAGGGLDFIDQVVPASNFEADSEGVLTDATTAPAQDFSTPLTSQSHNLYRITPGLYDPIRGDWPTAGSALVFPSALTPDGKPSQSAILVSVTAEADQADLTNRPVNLDADGIALISTSFMYRSDAAIDLDLYSNDGQHTPGTTPTWLSAYQFPLPANNAWTRVHRFSLVTQPIFDLSLSGTGALAAGYFARINVRHLRSQTKVAPSSTVVGGSDTTYGWTGLVSNQPYLIVVVLTPTGASGTLTADDDDTIPAITKVEAVDDSINQGAVILLQPFDTTLQLVASNALTIAAVHVQRYYGAFAGHEL